MSYFCFVFPCGFMTVLNICLFHTPPLDPILSSLFTFPHCNLCSTGFLVRVSCWAGDSQLLSYFGRMHFMYFPFGLAIFPIHSFVSLVVSTQERRCSYCTCQTWKDSYHAGLSRTVSFKNLNSFCRRNCIFLCIFSTCIPNFLTF